VTVESLGSRIFRSATELSVEATSGAVVPVRIGPEPALPADPFERLLARLENAPVAISESADGAIVGEAQMELLNASLELIRPSLPALKALGDSKILAVIGHIPGIGTPVKITQDAFGATSEIVAILEWYSEVDKKLSQPMRQGIIACARQMRSRSRADLPGTISGLQKMAGAAREYQSKGARAKSAVDRYQASVNRFQQAVESLREARGADVPDPTAPRGQEGTAKLTLQVQSLIAALTRQADDLEAFARAALEDARAARITARRTGGQS
jgi:hypothetical protein